ncbi:MAG: antibiotic biosynthesis monooxygenase [Armatimonadota bacterium]|nr:antibiotic biosynthesis monooxygenase [Armatimonadota bacterium]MDR5689646.1 antibiotic biosynthesis monooxygenase [Armatimonadota bacterium]MDR7393688.1 antibiotic biosynthesis monooxygenase [Armatimonadota bacterium]MDR7408684.1 antibiotic biosynthesis monooxygenase [Armatimonadota bacterium]MDR7413691.1 antibiotic biosynthesis monooxygenase [Armatimonadota bacterium]
MFVVMNRIPVSPEFQEAFEERFRSRAREVDRMPGFVRNWVLRPVDPEDPYVVVTVWQTREAFEAWTRSEAFQRGHARSGTLPREAFRGPSKLERYELILDSAAEGDTGA